MNYSQVYGFVFRVIYEYNIDTIESSRGRLSMWPLVPQPPEKSKENKMKQHAKCGETLPGKEMIFQGCITIVYVFRTRA